MIRRSLQLQLTLLYAVPFMISGALLLSLPLWGAQQTQPAPNPAMPPPEGAVQEGFDRVFAFTAIGYAVMVAVSLVLGWFIAGRFLRRLRTITATAREISATNLDRRLAIAGGDEFAQLARTLDDLFERLRRSFEAQRHFVANASHELRTPLTAERTLLQVALADPDADVETLRAVCEQTLELGRHQESLIAALLGLATSEQGVRLRVPVDLTETARRVLDRQQVRGIAVDAQLGPARTAGDPQLMESLVANLVENALRHNVPGGQVTVITRTAGGRAGVVVTNTGPVIALDQVERLFEPFARLAGERLHREGHGLGLAIVKAIATAHGARLAAQARPEGGLSVEVSFPG